MSDALALAPDAAATVEEAVSVRGAAARRGGRLVWRDVTCTVRRGELAAVLGPNGAGKSTLLHVLLGTLAPDAGQVRVLGRPPGAAPRLVGYLPQRRSFDAATRVRAVDLVRLGLDGDRWGLPSPFGRARRRREERVEEVLELVGAARLAHRAIGELSGGEQQRVLIAQALAGRPDLLLLDEPLDSLDLPNQRAVAALLAQICRDEGIAVVLVAHDVNPILAALDRVVYLAGGRAVQGRPEEVITSETLSRLYGVPVEVLRASDGRRVVVGAPDAPHHHSARHGL